jgi:hypothetical protein
LGSIERADKISHGIKGRALQRLVRISFGRCGNCAWRFACAPKIVPMKAIIEAVVDDGIPVSGHRPNMMSKAAVGVLRRTCLGKCKDTRLDRCVALMCEQYSRPELTRPILLAMTRWSTLTDDELIKEIDSIIRTAGIKQSTVIANAIALWTDCRLNNRFTCGLNAIVVGE